MLLTNEMIRELEDPNVGKWVKRYDGFTSIITDVNPIVHNHTQVSVTVNCYDPDDYSDKIIEKPVMTFTGNALVEETVYFHEKIVGPEHIVKNNARHDFRDIETLRKRDIDAFGLREFIGSAKRC